MIKFSMTFTAASYQEFDEKYKLLCMRAGGGIKNTYFRKTKNLYMIEFYYPSEKAALAGKDRILELKMPDLVII